MAHNAVIHEMRPNRRDEIAPATRTGGSKRSAIGSNNHSPLPNEFPGRGVRFGLWTDQGIDRRAAGSAGTGLNALDGASSSVPVLRGKNAAGNRWFGDLFHEKSGKKSY
jgi:hypothetical protein